MAPKPRALFGEDAGWNRAEWTSSDDRVRGGKSQSHLTISESQAVFHGNLDIETLGGAGFASQRTIGDDRSWNLSDYEGITLTLGEADEKKYTFIIKDEILPPSSSGREKSTLSYEYDFSIASTETKGETEIFIAWKDLKATYRGKEKEDSPQLNNKNIKRFSIMMRSFFGTQKGDFSLTIKSVAASNKPADPTTTESHRAQGLFPWLVSKIWKV